jgi:hypothetical protein
VQQLVDKFQERWTREPMLTPLRSTLADILASAGGTMRPVGLAEALLLTRGSVQEEPHRTRRAMAVVRGAVEAERTMSHPRYFARRDEDRVLIALTDAHADFARRLGAASDRLAREDPLAPPIRALERLRAVPPPPNADPLADATLLRLAVSASSLGCLSSRQEIYPRGLDVLRAVKLSQGALYGAQKLTLQEVRERVGSRYPDAAPLPPRPALDDLLRRAGLDLEWKADQGCYVNPTPDPSRITAGTGSLVRAHTGSTAADAIEVTPEVADARQFEERLQRGLKDGAFMVLLVNAKYYPRACDEFLERFADRVEVVDLEGVFLEALRAAAEKARVQWERVVLADAVPHAGDWARLMTLVSRAMPAVEERIRAGSDRERPGRTRLLIYPGVLARYDQMALLERLRDHVGRPDGLPGLWLLVPGDQHALMEGKAVPILGPGQRARIPEAWLENRHRGSTH